MKRLFKMLLTLIILGVLGGGAFVFWQMKNGELTPGTLTPPQESSEATPGAPAAQNTDQQTPSTAPASSAYDLTVQADGMSKAIATLTMEKGDVIKIRFYTTEAPNTVKRIAELIAQGFYNGIIVHRVVPGFVIQAGDPTGSGSGGSGVKLKAEFNSHKHEAGIVSMARTADPNSADSQFFIMLGAAPQLDGQYTVFGKVIEGFEHVPKIQRGDKIKSFTIQ